MQLFVLVHDTDTNRGQAPVGLGLAKTDHRTPFQRSTNVLTTRGESVRLVSPTVMQLVVLVHDTAFSVAVHAVPLRRLRGSGAPTNDQVLPSHRSTNSFAAFDA